LDAEQVDSSTTGRYPCNKRRANRVKSGRDRLLRSKRLSPCGVSGARRADTGVRIRSNPALRVPNDFVIVRRRAVRATLAS